MIYVIPMAGKGTRTHSLGEFKPFIEIKGHKMFSWFISSIKHIINEKDKFVLVTTEYFNNKFNFENETKNIFEQHKIHNHIDYVFTQENPRGSSETIFASKQYINSDEPVTIINPDQYVDFNMPEDFNGKVGYLGLYLNYGEKTGFVKIKNGLITRFVERKNISNIASSGIFIVSSGKDLLQALSQQLSQENAQEGEYYIGNSFNYLIKNNFKIFPVMVFCKYDLGTVENIETFSNRNILCL